jgi:hypothetical protein
MHKPRSKRWRGRASIASASDHPTLDAEGPFDRQAILGARRSSRLRSGSSQLVGPCVRRTASSPRACSRVRRRWPSAIGGRFAADVAPSFCETRIFCAARLGVNELQPRIQPGTGLSSGSTEQSHRLR